MTAKPGAGTTSNTDIEPMMGVMTDLTSVLIDEIGLLKKQDVAGIQNLLRRKNRLLSEYHAGLKNIAANPGLLVKAPAETRARLKAVGLKLAEASERNAKALLGAVHATQRLIQYIINTVKQETLPAEGYNRLRPAQGTLGTYSPTCQPLAVRRTA